MNSINNAVSNNVSNATPKYRPQLTLIEIESICAGLRISLENAIANGHEIVKSVEGHDIPLEVVNATYVKMASFKHKLEIGLNKPAYLQTHTKVGRKSVSDTLKEDYYTETEERVKSKQQTPKAASAFNLRDIAYEKFSKYTTFEERVENLSDEEYLLGYEKLMELNQLDNMTDMDKSHYNKLSMAKFNF